MQAGTLASGKFYSHWVWCNGRGPHDKLRQEPQGSSPGFECAGSELGSQSPCRVGTGESGLVLCGGMELRLTLALFMG